MQPRTPTPEQDQHLQAWRYSALEQMPYFAPLLFSLRTVDAPGLGTFAVDDQHRLYVDFDAVTPKGVTWCAEALLHECGHLWGEHADLATTVGVQPNERHDWNVAADASINDDLRDAGCASIAADGVLPTHLGQPDHLTALDYFGALRARRSRQRQGGNGRPDPGAPNHGPHGSEGPGEPYRGCGSGSGAAPAPCELTPDDDLAGTAPAATAAEKARVAIATAAAVRQHAADGHGRVPAGIRAQADLVLTPSQVPWQRVLAGLIRQGVRWRLGDTDVDPTRRHRRKHNQHLATPTGPGPRIVYPGTVSPVPTIAVVRDTSASMGGREIARATSEIVAIARRLAIRGPDLRIIDVDAAAHAVRGYTRPAALAEVNGGGGTDMRTGIDAALGLRPRPSVVAVLTDGMTDWPAQRTRVPVVAVIVGRNAEQRAAQVPSWIRTVVADTE